MSEALKSNWIAPQGPALDAFEKDLQNFNTVANTCALASGTAAIHLALILLEVQPGDAVFIQSHTHIASVNPIIYRGATPIFIDSEPNTWNMCPQHLENAILAVKEGSLKSKVQDLRLDTSKPSTFNQQPSTFNLEHSAKNLQPSTFNQQPSTENLQPSTTNLKPKCILPVHLYGMPANMDAIMAVANKYKLPVLEDAAESLGSTYLGKKTGSIGKLGVYSFNGNKIITTSGGGALVSREKELIDRARFLSTQARDEAPHYQHSTVGYNYRLSNVLAGIGRGQMQVLDERIAQRRANFDRYRQYFTKLNEKGYHIEFQEEQEGTFSNRWLTCILVDPEKNKGLTRETIRLALAEENIEARPLWKPMHLQPVFEGYHFFGDGTAERLFDIGLCLPSGSNLIDGDFNRIFSKLDSIVKHQ